MSASFLKIPNTIHHALLILTALAEAGRAELSLEQIASSSGLSRKYLERIIAPLRRAGIVAGRRGSGGGYRLVVAPSRLDLARVVEAVSGPLKVMDCLGSKQACRMMPNCLSRRVWALVQSRLYGTLKGLTLSAIVKCRV